MYKNELYAGSIKDQDEIWHVVMVSPDEDFVQRYCQHVVDNPFNFSFYTDEYTVELIPIVVTEDYISNDDELDDWFNKDIWLELSEDDIYEEIISVDMQNGQ